MMWGGCWRGLRKTCQGRRHGVENDAAKAAARSGDFSGGLRKESDGLKKRERERERGRKRDKRGKING